MTQFMSRFNDENDLGDILGCIYLAETWGPRSDFDIHDLLAEIKERIHEKLGRNNNRIRHNWFTNALESVEKAVTCYQQNDCQQGDMFLRKAEELLQDGNKAHRRKTNFIVGPDGISDKA